MLGEPVAKGWRRGTHRAASPEATLARLAPLRTVCGITRLADVTGLDRIGLPVIQSVRPNARSTAVSMGKGVDLAAARASALMEAIETWHAERIDRPLRLARWRELHEAGWPVVDLAALPRHARHALDPERSILWIEGRDLARDAGCWLPFELAHADDTVELPGGGSFPASTNGLAGGNHLLEARAHALCEVIERDAVALWFQRTLRARAATALDLESIDHPDARDVLARLAAAGFGTVVWDVTSDLGVPAFLAGITDHRDPTGHPGLGAGCHLSKAVAVLRALTEAAQVRLTYIAGARDDIPSADCGASAVHERTHRLRALAGKAGGGRDFGRLPSLASDDFALDVQVLLRQLEAAGITRVVEVELTRAELGIPVVRIVAPGLEGPHDHPDYVPGPRALAARDAAS